MPGLAAGLFRLVWMVLPPMMGTRRMVSLTTLLLIASTLGWGLYTGKIDSAKYQHLTAWLGRFQARPVSCAHMGQAS